MTDLRARPVSACRHCGGALSIPFCDLGATPVANAFITPERAGLAEPSFPLNVVVCARCFMAQLDHSVDSEDIFDANYAYFSSFSTSWLSHAADYARTAIARLDLGATSFVVEVASNDGYLLKNFVAAGIPCLGVEPSANTAAAAEAAGVPTLVRFFGRTLADEIVATRGHADLVAANNVLAHVPDINDFVAGLARLIGPNGVVTVEAPHLLNLVRDGQFDTIYHEHYAYWSLYAIEQVFATQGLRVFDVDRLTTHGGSLRVWAAAQALDSTSALIALRAEETAVGVTNPEWYAGFQPRVTTILDDFRAWLAARAAQGRRVAAYGAAAKGNTFLNAAGVGADAILAVADRNPQKQGRLCPGSRIPVVSPEALTALAPDDVIILPWNLAGEIAAQLRPMAQAGTRLWIAVPRMIDVTPS